jgi:hypothetical protein
MDRTTDTQIISGITLHYRQADILLSRRATDKSGTVVGTTDTVDGSRGQTDRRKTDRLIDGRTGITDRQASGMTELFWNK